jgi:D-alanine-D-alanine ligase
MVIRMSDKNHIYDIEKKFSYPMFIKPANLGSSVGVSKAHNRNELEKAIHEAFTYDKKIIVEEFIKGREVECAILGNNNPKASIAGEIIPTHEFYDYDAKYLDDNGATLQIPAAISDQTLREVQELAIKTFIALETRGLARIDFFLTESGRLYVNEINTMPGFTTISMYPKLWEASGTSYQELINQLIELAVE